MLKHLNGLLSLQFKCRKLVLDQRVKWRVLWFKIFLSLSNITHLFLVYARISSTILKFLQGFQKLAVFPLLPLLSIFLKSTCLLLAVFLKFIFNLKEKRGFIWSKTFDFLFQKPSNICSEKRVVP